MHCRSNNPCVNISFDGVDVKTTGRFSDAPHWNCSHAFGSAIGDVKPPLNGCLLSELNSHVSNSPKLQLAQI